MKKMFLLPLLSLSSFVALGSEVNTKNINKFDTVRVFYNGENISAVAIKITETVLKKCNNIHIPSEMAQVFDDYFITTNGLRTTTMACPKGYPETEEKITIGEFSIEAASGYINANVTFPKGYEIEVQPIYKKEKPM